MLVTAPPPIHGWQDLQMAQASLSDAVLTCVDFENIDHYVSDNGPINKLSEVGIATIDLRRLRRPLDQVEFEDVAKAVESRHTIVKTWDWVTPKNCPAGWHEKLNKAHIADPYNCRFSESRIAPNGMARNDAPNPLEVAQAQQAAQAAEAQPSTAGSPTNEESGSADASSTTGSPVDIWDADQSDNDSEVAWSSGDPVEDWDIPAADPTPSPWEEMYHAQAARANSDPRKVYVLFWDANLEKITFNATEDKSFDQPADGEGYAVAPRAICLTAQGQRQS
ncbi:hypothetical protein V8F33_006667 [Rhypophila sp. PSN 637]